MSRRKKSHQSHGTASRPRLWGKHAVAAALDNSERKVLKAWATREGAASMQFPAEVAVTLADVADLGRLVPHDAPHQGVVIEVEPLEEVWLDEILTGADERAVLLVLDQVTDPHNVGAILRTAAGFAVAAVVTTARHSPEATGVLAKSASGALEYVPIVTVQNLARALEALRERGYLLVGLDSTGDIDLGDAPLRAPLALVLGAEGKGLRQLTRATCDRVARLDLPGRIKSLNVSNAAALALYVASKRTT
jgi:23S rRNA (guanosine2251-2'-O)-methyltransferase